MEDIQYLAKCHTKPNIILKDNECSILGLDYELMEFKDKVDNLEWISKLHSDASLNALKKVIANRYEEYWKYKLDTDEGLKEVFPILKKLNIIKEERDKEKDSDYIFITVNPRDDVNFWSFYKKVNDVIKKKWITQYAYSFEQRGETDNDVGFRPHAHILLYRKGKSYSEIVREFKSSFRKMCNVDNEHILNFKIVKMGTELQIVNYISGDKKDDWKLPKVVNDRKWREINNLQNVYDNGLIDKLKLTDKDYIDVINGVIPASAQ